MEPRLAGDLGGSGILRQLGALTAVVLASGAAAAQEPVSPAQFEALATGRTLHFTRDGVHFGSEQYFRDRRALWMFFDGTCEVGRWEPQGDLVCFTYEDDPQRQCWRLWREDGRLLAGLAGPDPGPPLRLSHADETDLACPGPEIGS